MPQYYPKSQIQTNLYTPGSKYQILISKKPYKGYYYCISNGTKYTGKFPGDGKNLVLTPTFNNDPANPSQTLTDNPLIEQISTDIAKYEGPYTDFDTNSYIKLKNQKNISKVYPTPSTVLPTNKEKKLGVFNRFFCKKNNESVFFEISKDTYTQLLNKTENITYELFTPTRLEWVLSAPSKEILFFINKEIVVSKQRELGWFGFLNSFNDNFLEYSKFI